MESLQEFGKLVLVVTTVLSVAYALHRASDDYSFAWQVWKRFRVRMFLEVLGVISLTAVAVAILWQVPGLKYGWLNLFYENAGNMMIKPVMDGTESESRLIRLSVPLFLLALTLALPFLAREEEDWFRKGHTHWNSILKQSVKFGLVHLFVGVPLAGALVIILPGFFYGYKYKRTFDRLMEEGRGLPNAMDEALMVSITNHTLYNTTLILFLILTTLTRV